MKLFSGFPRSAGAMIDRSGAAATELALMLPLLLTLALGATDFSRIIRDYIVVSNASCIGAEYGATHRFTSYTRSAWEAQLRAAIMAEMDVTPGFDPEKLQIDINVAPDDHDLVRITVDAEYPFTPIVNWPALPQTVQLWRRTSMREIQ
jgi:Flp pilus assembly protein TadG